jgi:hypothetical protein
MNKDMRKKRVALLSEVDQLQSSCKGCAIRTHYHNLRDATGLSHACKVCPVGNQISEYGEKLTSLISSRKRIRLKA